jgi:RNA polymerase sigma-70 factor (ECF subfamily)
VVTKVPALRPAVPTLGAVDGSVLAVLLGQVAAGVPAAFDELYAGTVGTVLRVTQAVLVDRSQAEEVTQEVFLEIWRQAGRFDPARGSAAAWIWRIAHARAVDRVRRAQSVRNTDQRYAQHHFERDIDSVVDQVLRDCDITALRAALPALTDLQLQAMQLTYFTGHTHLQASALLGIPVATYKSRVMAALKALRRCHPSRPAPEPEIGSHCRSPGEATATATPSADGA